MANDPVTPADTPSSPSGFASVTPHGRGPAPYDIQAPAGDVTGAFSAANADAGAGVLYPQSLRQQETRDILESPAGYGVGGADVDAGTTVGWPANVEPGG